MSLSKLSCSRLLTTRNEFTQLEYSFVLCVFALERGHVLLLATSALVPAAAARNASKGSWKNSKSRAPYLHGNERARTGKAVSRWQMDESERARA